MGRVTCHRSPVTCHLSLTPTATATDPPPTNSPIMHLKMQSKNIKKNCYVPRPAKRSVFFSIFRFVPGYYRGAVYRYYKYCTYRLKQKPLFDYLGHGVMNIKGQYIWVWSDKVIVTMYSKYTAQINSNGCHFFHGLVLCVLNL